MKNKNPFYLLGLHPDLVAKLSLEELTKVIETQRRILLSIYHPDKHLGSKDRSTDEMYNEINSACDELEQHPEILEAYRQKYVRSGSYKKQAEDFETRLGSAQRKSAVLYRALCAYLLSASGLSSQQNTVFNCYPCSLKMLDYTLKIGMGPWTWTKCDGAFYQLDLDSEGKITKNTEGSVSTYPNKKLIGTISRSIVENNRGIVNILKRVQRIFTPEDAIMNRIKGHKVDSDDVEDYKPEISLESFVNIAHLVNPPLNKGDYLFSINRRDGKDYSFPQNYFLLLEGKVLNIDKTISGND